MASAGQVDVKVAVKPKVAIGTSTVAGGTVSLVAFALALVAFWQGARDEATVSALVVGLVSLVTVLGGRYAQAVAALVVTARRPTIQSQDLAKVVSGSIGGSVGLGNTATATGTTFSYPRPGVEMTHPDAVKPLPSSAFFSQKPGEFTREPKAPHPDELRDLHDGDQT